ncbi:MAG: GAF domain-containing protein [Gammaproteobacteria bacterium]|nr:GAF domain-containing protein [Gammaproteobacteria bacterium]
MTGYDDNGFVAVDSSIDLSNCDREPIHILGRVQSFGALLAVSADWIINHASQNIDDFIGMKAEDLVGCPAGDHLDAQAVHDIRSKFQLLSSADAVERLLNVDLLGDGKRFDLMLHVAGRSIVIEIERHDVDAKTDYISFIRPMIDRMSACHSVDELSDLAARQIRALCEFDRVMIYRFERDESGTVVAESAAPGIDSFLGLRYPASDIPKQARALYRRNLLRMISDVHDEGAAIFPPRSPEGVPLDLSLSATRSVSRIHIEYLKNMGVNASMSISILRRGELWGLFACHHYSPRVLPVALRGALELFGQLFSYVLDQKLSDAEAVHRLKAQRLHDHLMTQLAEGARIADSFDQITDAIGQVIPYDGVAAWVDGEFLAKGQTPSREELLSLVRFLNTTSPSQVYSTDCIGAQWPAASHYAERAAGLLSLPVSRTPRDFIVLFRKELAQTVTWAGNPEKPVEWGPNGARLSPRESFEEWKQITRGCSAPWSDGEIRAAESLRLTLLEVVLRMTDIVMKERDRAQQQQELLISELNHRVRNILNLVRGLIGQTSGKTTSVEAFIETVGGRIHALSRAHDQITRKQWDPASIKALLRAEVEAYVGVDTDRLQLQGPDVLLHPNAFTAIALVFHELTTNAVKYGSLTDQHGKVVVEIHEGEDGSLAIDWREVGGPPISEPPVSKGFGSVVIERSIPHELKGDVALRFTPTGLNVHILIPPPHIAAFRYEAPDTQAPKPVQQRPRTADTGSFALPSVLLVEDNMIIAIDSEDLLKKVGAETVYAVSNVKAAMRVLDNENVDFALLDVNLGLETSEPVAERLVAAGIPFCFATGYGDSNSLAARFPDAPVLQKPFDHSTLTVVLETILSRH